jgi:hypothetical protein
MHAELKDGFYSRQFIHHPARDFEHLAEQLAPFCPRSDDRYVGVVVKGGLIKEVMQGENPDDIEFGELSPFHQHGTAFADERKLESRPDDKNLTGRVDALSSLVEELFERVDSLTKRVLDLEGDAVDDLPISELRAKAKALGISAGGSKQEIADRIAQHEAGE